jgi:predicted phage-related endonuclease
MNNFDIDSKVIEINELEAKIKEFKAQVELLKNSIKDEFDERKVSIIHTDNFNLSWVPVYKSVFDSASFKKEDPETYAKFAKESSYLRFAISAKK